MLWKLLHDAVVTCLYRTLIGRIIQIMNVSKMESICLGCGTLRFFWLPVCDMVHSPFGVPAATSDRLSCHCLLQELGSLWIIAANIKQTQITCILHREQAINCISDVSMGQYYSLILGFYKETQQGLINDQKMRKNLPLHIKEKNSNKHPESTDT